MTSSNQVGSKTAKVSNATHTSFVLRELSGDASQRRVRVFISSTFRDMMAEREHLMKQVFPELRRRCRERGVDFMEVDLRWGVTEEAAKQGKVIEICLSEIDKSRPYFLGILGERYGWAPPTDEYEKHRKIIEDFPWVKADIEEGLSITEMEIQYGVLRNPSMKGNAFFYLRDPKSLPSDSLFRELPGSIAARKLGRLKDTLRNQKDFPLRDYGNVDLLGEQVFEDLWRMIDAAFPMATTPSPLETQRLEHLAFLKSRQNVYIGGERYFDRLDKFIEADSDPIVIVGAAGSGKSALVANWITRYQQQHPDAFILFHFVGGPADSTDTGKSLMRLMQEIKLEFGIEEQVPGDPAYMQKGFAEFLGKTSGRKWVLVIDGIDRLHSSLFASTMWLPERFPENVRVIFTASPGETLDVLTSRKYEAMQIDLLSPTEARVIIEQYLLAYGKSLRSDNVEIIVSDDGARNPLTLRTLLDELRVFGVHEKLDHHLARFLRANNPVEFFDSVLQRMEEDYEHDSPGLVSKMLGLLRIATKGMTEDELLTISGIPQLHWSPFHSALDNQLLRTSGSLHFSNSIIAEAVDKRYLNSESKRRAAMIQLRDYFANNFSSERSLDELPSLYLRMADWERLKEFVTDVRVFHRLFTRRDIPMLIVCMKELASRYELSKEFLHAIDRQLKGGEVDPLLVAEACSEVAPMLSFRSSIEDVAAFYERSLAIRREKLGDVHLLTAVSMMDVGHAYTLLNRYEHAEILLKKALEVLESISPSHLKIRDAAAWLANVYKHQGRFDEAAKLLERSMAVAAKTYGQNSPADLQALMSKAQMALMQGLPKQAVAFCEEAVSIATRCYGAKNAGTVGLRSHLAMYCKESGDTVRAEKLYKEFFVEADQVLGENTAVSMAASLYGEMLVEQQRYTEALEVFVKGLEIGVKATGTMRTAYVRLLQQAEQLARLTNSKEGVEYFHAKYLEESGQINIASPPKNKPTKRKTSSGKSKKTST